MSKRVLIAPLPWGLGHATRCVPIIDEQLAAGNEVLIAANAPQRALFNKRFKGVEFVDLPFMEITYPKDGNMSRHFFWRGPRLLYSIWREHRLLQALIKHRSIDTVISDSRFGLWNKKVHSIFVTHQLCIRSPHAESIINALNRWVLQRYDEVWVPDYATPPGLAGALSHPKRLPGNAKYIGPLSRFKAMQKPDPMKLKNFGVVSGPEPMRTAFELELARKFIETGGKSLIVNGKPDLPDSKSMGELEVLNHLEDERFAAAVLGAEQIYARSGYSTIMDLDALGRTAHYTPTPGQTEQEYLAELHRIN